METENGMMEENQQNPASGLGTRLKTARESLHLSQKDVAVRLHLGPSMIQIIENEDFRRAPPPTFMRGYVRSYAKLLNLAVTDDEINLALSQSGIDLTPKTTMNSMLQTTESIEKADRYVHIITMLILAVSLVLVGIWWKSHKTTADTVPVLVQNPIATPQQPPAPVAEQPTVATNVAAPPATAVATPTTTPTAAATAPTTTPAPVQQPATTQQPQPVVAETPAAPANVPPTENTTTPAIAPPVVANTTTTPPPADATIPAPTPETGVLPPLAPPPVTGLANAAPVQPIPDANQATDNDDQPRKKRHRRSADFDNRVSGMAMALPEPGL